MRHRAVEPTVDVKCTSSMHICGLILAGVGRVIGSVFIIAVPDDMLHDNVHCVCKNRLP